MYSLGQHDSTSTRASSLRTPSVNSSSHSSSPTQQPPTSQATRSLSSEGTAAISVPKHKKHLKSPKFLYPLQYGRQSREVEVWLYSFIQACRGGCPLLTPLDLIAPNPVMLHIACGYGTWCILAGRFFKQAKITGFDIANIQPDLKKLVGRDLSDRITWVHGDMLEGLPFPDNTFDVVHSLDIGYCVPEIKWTSLIEEIARVLKPGGIFDMNQQDLIFPCPKFPPRLVEPRDAAAMEADGDEGKAGISKELADIDPRDHSRLREAFDAMLENIFMTPVFKVALPPSSFVRDQEDRVTGVVLEPELVKNQDLYLPADEALRTDRKDINQDSISYVGGQMDLYITMVTILSSKEAMWEQFEVLNPVLKRSDFDYLFKNWEFDMRDRIDMKTALRDGLNWPIPPCNEEPERRLWRSEMLRFHEMDNLWDAQSIPEPCRSVRAFRAVKAKRPPLTPKSS